MLGDLNLILDGLSELEEKGIKTIDCRRAQFSAEEPILRLRMICQSWKVMFQAEYSSGQPLRMLVDLRASVEAALGREANSTTQAKTPAPPMAAAAAAAAGGKVSVSRAPSSKANHISERSAPKATKSNAAEFEISAASEWDSDGNPQKTQ